MALEILPDCILLGPALPEPFVRLELEAALTKAGLLPKTTGEEGRRLQECWEVYRRKLRELGVRGGTERVRNHVIEPLVERLGYARLADGGKVKTSLDVEDGGVLLITADGSAQVRAWTTELGADLDAPARRGAAYRYSPARIAERVLLASGERLGLLTNGLELRMLFSDPARPDSQIIIPIDQLWMSRGARNVPDSYRLLLALASPQGVRFLPDLIDQARLQQARVTKELRVQAQQAIEGFIQHVLNHPENRFQISGGRCQLALSRRDGVKTSPPETRDFSPDELAQSLWREGLIIIYRLLFVLKLESSDDPARRFSFAGASLWQNTYSPGYALARHARRVLDEGADTGRLLEDGLRTLFHLLAHGVEFPALTIKPLVGGLFDENATPLLSRLRWGERAVALVLDRLLWTTQKRGSNARERVHYGPLDVEELGRVYEALLEREPGIAIEPMCRLRRQKLEVVVPLAQGEKYRANAAAPAAHDNAESADEDAEEAEEEQPASSKKTNVEWVEAIEPGRFYLRAGLGRKTTGSYYTPHSFVRFLVQETLGLQCAERSPDSDPHPERILALKVLDPATGSGHFLVEACRFLGDRLYEACRRCDELASAAERQAEHAQDAAERDQLIARAIELRRRVEDLPDPNHALLDYLPSRAAEGDQPGVSERKARALCRRLAAVHCLYGVDKNPLAIELARLALWIEAHAEGLPLTFLDHRLIVGDSLTGPFFEHLLTFPGSRQPLNDLFHQGLRERFMTALGAALAQIRDLEGSIGASAADIEAKQRAKRELDRALAPFRLAAAAWAGGVMLGRHGCDDDAYAWLVAQVAGIKAPAAGDNRAHGSDAGGVGSPEAQRMPAALHRMIARGLGLPAPLPAKITIDDALAYLTPAIHSRQPALIPALPYDLTFPEVFFPTGDPGQRGGFDAVIGNPPWDRMLPADKEFFASYDFSILEAPTKREREGIEKKLRADPSVAAAYAAYIDGFRSAEQILEALYNYQVATVDGERTIGKQDAFRAFMERNYMLLNTRGHTGVVVPSAFHANEGATGIRRLYLEEMALRCCYSFENRRKLFEIHASFKFATVVAARQGPTREFACAFYLHDDAWLFEPGGREPLRYSLDFVRRTGGEYLSLLELRSPHDAEVAQVCFANGEPFGHVCERLGIRLGRELNMTDDAWRFTPTSHVLPGGEDPRDPAVAAALRAQGYLVLHEGKTFHQYTDRWEAKPQYLLHVQKIDRASWLQSIVFWRLALRKVASATNERTFVMALLPTGVLTGDSAFADQSASSHSTAYSLLLLSICCSFSYDFVTRQMVSANVNLFIANRLPVPQTLLSTSPQPSKQPTLAAFLAHAALRLTCNHAGYAALWHEQVGEEWREKRAPFDWPALASDDARWQVRAAIDAIVADAYGLNRAQYAHVLATFSHKSYPQAPALCLAAFDELKKSGLESFIKQHDPYWDIPLNQNLPQPVITLPKLAGCANATPAGDEPVQTVIDFGEAAETLRAQRPAKQAAERRTRYRAGNNAPEDGPPPPDSYERLKALLAERGAITSGDAQAALGIAATAVRPLLRRLVEEGLARQEGEKRGTRYRLAEGIS